MAQPTNTVAVNDLIVNEDLQQVIWNVDPDDTIFTSLLKRTDAKNTTYEWLTESLRASGTNAVIEGDDVTANAVTGRTRLNNVAQLSDESWRVSSTARKVDVAGTSDEFNHQRVKKGKELKLDVEKALCNNLAKVPGNDSTARVAAGAPVWLTTATDFGSGGADATGDGSDARTDGTQRAFTEDQVKSVMQTAWTNGGKPSIAMMGGRNRQIFSTFGPGTPMQKVEDKTMHASFSVYESDYGPLKVMPNREMRARDVLLLDMSKWEMPILQDYHDFALPKSGHSYAHVVAVEWGLKCLNEKASAGIFDLETS